MIRKALYFSLLTAFVSGISIFANGVFVTKADPVLFALVRNAFVVVLLTGTLIFSGSMKKLVQLSRRQWIKLFAIGAIGGGIPFALFFAGLAQIGAVSGTVIHKSLFLWVALLAIPILGETLHWLTIIGYGIIFSATFFMGGKFAFVPNVGSFMVLGATILWAIEQIIAKKTLVSVSPPIVAWARMIFGLPFLLGACVVSGSVKILTPGFFQTTALAIIVSSILLSAYMLTWYQALKRAPATLVSAILVLAPALTMALQSGLLHKPVQGVQIQSLAVVAVGVFFVAIPIVKRHTTRV